MERPLAELAEILRQNGLKLASLEVEDAVRALAAVGLTERELVRGALKATLVKRVGDVATFDRVFDLFFSGASRLIEQLDGSLARRLEEAGLLEGDELAMLLATLDAAARQLSPLTRAALEGDQAALAGILRKATLELDLSRLGSAMETGFYSRRLLAAAGGEAMRGDLAGLARELEARGVSTTGVDLVSRHLAEALRGLEAAARAEVQRAVETRAARGATGPGEVPLARLSREELELATRSVRRLAERLKSRLTRRQRSRRRGQLSPRRTLRRNLAAGGVPMVPCFRARRPMRPDVVVLCDVSDSVRATSRLMLLFTWTLQSLFSRVRSFLFVSELAEVTESFEGASPEEAVEVTMGGDAVSRASNSNYGHALAMFARHHLGAVSRRTTVFVIGDGRNNFNELNTWALEEIHRKARRVVWIATEPREQWGLGDSAMPAYARAVSQVVVVRSLADLERVADQLVPRV